MSAIVIITAIESGFGFLLACVILYLLFTHATKTYHYLFATFLLLCALWDLGTFLLMVRNSHTDELELIGYIIAQPCAFIPALIFHFSTQYTGRSIKWAVILVYILTGILLILGLFGLYWKIEGVYVYSWGNIFKVLPSVFDPLGIAVWIVFCFSACWFLFLAAKRASDRVQRRHFLYIGIGTLVITLAIVKTGVVMGINAPVLLPMGMFLVDCFNAIIGIAIIKDRLFDITLIIKKGTLFSLLAALLIFTYSLIEHILVTFVGEKIGENSTVLHLIAVGVGIAVLMPVKNRIEKGVERYFAHRKLEF